MAATDLVPVRPVEIATVRREAVWSVDRCSVGGTVLTLMERCPVSCQCFSRKQHRLLFFF
jgi:hypothetical protein